MIKNIKNNDFDTNEINEVTMVAFSAPWCGPCRMMAPVYEEIAKTENVIKVDTEENQDLAAKLQIRSIPAILIFNKNGEQVKTFVGATSKDKLTEAINSAK